MIKNDGKCASCGSPGPAGRPCDTFPCTDQGRHRIPNRYVQDLPPVNKAMLEPLLGKVVDGMLLAGVLGRGGFGKVYLALQLPGFAEQALKLMTLDPDPDSVERFQREAELLSRLEHPNIVRVFGGGTYQQYPYFLMECLRGGVTLRREMLDHFGGGRRLRPERVRLIISQILSALDVAHHMKIVHRDIKPENVMIMHPNQPAERVVVMDFGLAKVIEQGTRTVAVTGTPSYMAPEQIYKRHIGPWTDLFAVGVLAFELLVGRRLYRGGSVRSLLLKKVDENFDPLSEFGLKALPDPVRRFFRKAIAWDPNLRFRSVAEFRQAFGGAIDCVEPIVAAGALDWTGLISNSAIKTLEQERRALVAEKSHFDSEREQVDKLRQTLLSESVESLQVYLGLEAPTVPAPSVPLTVDPIERHRTLRRVLLILVCSVLCLAAGWLGVTLWTGADLPAKQPRTESRPVDPPSPQTKPPRGNNDQARKPPNVPPPMPLPGIPDVAQPSMDTLQPQVDPDNPEPPVPVLRTNCASLCGCYRRINPKMPQVGQEAYTACLAACQKYLASGNTTKLSHLKQGASRLCRNAKGLVPIADPLKLRKLKPECEKLVAKQVQCNRQRLGRAPNPRTRKTLLNNCLIFVGLPQMKKYRQYNEERCAEFGIHFTR